MSRPTEKKLLAESLLLMSGERSSALATIAQSGNPGEIRVQVGGGESVPARVLSSVDLEEVTGPAVAGRQVLVVFPGGDVEQPVIVGLLRDPLEQLIDFREPEREIPEEKTVTVDGKRLVIEAEEEVELKCGEASILLRKDGKLIIKGTNLLSRSKGPNRIRGASITLN